MEEHVAMGEAKARGLRLWFSAKSEIGRAHV